MRAASVMIFVTLSGCVIDRSPLEGASDPDAEAPALDAAASEEDAESPDAAPTTDGGSALDAHTLADAYSIPDAVTAEDARVVPDAFAPGDAPIGCVDEACNRRDDDCDGLVDESGCATGTAGDCQSRARGERVYLVCPDLLDWTAARDGCAALGYALATIDSAEENAAIASWIPGDSWIGLNDRDDEDTFVWVDGSAPAFTSWSDREPNDSWGEDCALVRQNTEWNDVDCNDEDHTFVCEGAVAPR